MRIEDMDEPQLGNLMSVAALMLDTYFLSETGEKPMFALLVFNDPALGQYVGNCNRQDMVKAFRESADRLESREDVTRETQA